MSDDLIPAPSRTPLADATRRIDSIPGDSVDVGVTAENGRIGVEGQAKVDVGKGWSVGAWGRWAKDAGYAAAATVGWRKKAK